MPDKHALLSPSAAERWLHCTRAPHMEEQFPAQSSAAADEGTLAHKIAELQVRKRFCVMKPSEYTKKMKEYKADPLFQKEMLKHVDTYIDCINKAVMEYEHTPFIAPETELKLNTFAPESFGTADCVMVGAGVLRIFDFKYGQHVFVSADHNPQMMLYALGALELFSPIYTVERVVMTIVQPRMDNVSSFEMTRDDLNNWGAFDVKPKAKLAFAGEGDFTPGGWCRFCKARGRCTAYADYAAPKQVSFDAPEYLSDAELGERLTLAQRLKAWLTDIEAYTLGEVLKGRTIPGWKAVEAQSRRKISDVDKAFAALNSAGYDDAVLYRREPIGLTELEKVVGKSDLTKICGDYIIKPPGGPKLAPESDKRPPYNSAAADFANVAADYK